MKLHRTWLFSAVAIQSFIATVAIAADQGPLEGTAKVIRLKGSARYTTGQFVWQPIKVGQVLHPGTVIQTSNDEETYVDLALGDTRAVAQRPAPYHPGIPSSMTSSSISFQRTSEQNVIRIWKDSAVGLDKLVVRDTGSEQVTETELDLKRGRLAGNVKKLTAGSKYEVKFVNGVAAVRGTVFGIEAMGLIEVYIGSMVVAWVDPKTQKVTTQTINGGQGYDAPNNQLSPLSLTSTIGLEQLSGDLQATSVEPNFITVAADRTVIGISPIGASPAGLPSGNPPAETGGVEMTFQNGPPPVDPGAP